MQHGRNNQVVVSTGARENFYKGLPCSCAPVLHIMVIMTKNNGIQASPFEGDLIYGMIIAIGFSTSNESPRV